jgi:hypothetical protein
VLLLLTATPQHQTGIDVNNRHTSSRSGSDESLQPLKSDGFTNGLLPNHDPTKATQYLKIK